MTERSRIVIWLTKEASYARHAQENAVTNTDKLYRMGQKDALIMAAEAIDGGAHSPTKADRRAHAIKAAAARFAKLSPARRSEIASIAAKARWAKRKRLQSSGESIK